MGAQGRFMGFHGRFRGIQWVPDSFRAFKGLSEVILRALGVFQVVSEAFYEDSGSFKGFPEDFRWS